MVLKAELARKSQEVIASEPMLGLKNKHQEAKKGYEQFTHDHEKFIQDLKRPNWDIDYANGENETYH